MKFISMDKPATILMLLVPSILFGKLLYYIGILSCCSSFFGTLIIWLSAATVFLRKSSMKLSTEDKAVLITGCDSGFGLALAKHLHDIGFTVFAACLLADKNGEGAESLKQLNSDRMHVLQLDVTKEDDVKSVRKQVDHLLPKDVKFWAIVNNAGMGTFGDLEWVPLESFKRIADVNVFGMISMCKEFLPLVRKSKGRIINMASMLGRMAVPMRSPYCLTKFAIEGLSDCLRQEMKPWDVDVIVIEPGNFIAGTSIFTTESVAQHGENMWNNMSEETKHDYGEDFFKERVEQMKSYVNDGESDISHVTEAIKDSLLHKYPQKRYEPMEWYYKLRTFCWWHLPEAVYDKLYIGCLKR